MTNEQREVLQIYDCNVLLMAAWEAAPAWLQLKLNPICEEVTRALPHVVIIENADEQPDDE